MCACVCACVRERSREERQSFFSADIGVCSNVRACVREQRCGLTSFKNKKSVVEFRNIYIFFLIHSMIFMEYDYINFQSEDITISTRSSNCLQMILENPLSSLHFPAAASRALFKSP